jgi:hypothetical protein
MRMDFHKAPDEEETFFRNASNVGEDFKCSNRKCRGDIQGHGGVHIGSPLRDMIEAKETRRTFRHKCERPCQAIWDITMDVKSKS